jgi:putative transposase
MICKPWTFFMVAIAGWMNRQQHEAIAYPKAENQILREKLGKKRNILNDGQKRRLAAAAATLGRDTLRQREMHFSPNTFLGWNRWFIGLKYDSSDRRDTRGPKPKKANSVHKVVLQMAEASPNWGYGRIYGEFKKFGDDVHWQTVRRVMLDHGLLPDPDKPYKTTWKTFLQSHWDSISACDFFTVEAWGLKGLTRYLVFFVIELATRRVQIAGIHAHPCETQMVQWARNLTNAHDGFLKDKQILIHDRDRLFSKTFQETLGVAMFRCLKMPRWSPNLNSFGESWIRAAKREYLDKIVFFGERQVRYVIEQYVEHYDLDRPHKGLEYRRPVEPDASPPRDGLIKCRERLGGLPESHCRDAA